MSTLGATTLQPHGVALCILVQGFVLQRLCNRKRLERRRAAAEQRRSQQQQQQAEQAEAQQSPAENAFRSPLSSPSPLAAASSPSASAASHSFFSSPSPSTPAAASVNASTLATPPPVLLNLGLNLGLGGGAAPGGGAGVHVDADIKAQGQEQPQQMQEQPENFAPFSKRCYLQLGLFLHKAIQNGCIYDPSAFTSSSSSTPAADSPFPTSPPRYPTLAELRGLLVAHLPQQDDFHLEVEAFLVEELANLRQPDDLLDLISSLSTLLISYSHKIPLTEHQPLYALDESSPLGLFVREQRLQLEAGLFETVSRAFESLEKYKAEAGLESSYEMPLEVGWEGGVTMEDDGWGLPKPSPVTLPLFPPAAPAALSAPPSSSLDSDFLHPNISVRGRGVAPSSSDLLPPFPSSTLVSPIHNRSMGAAGGDPLFDRMEADEEEEDAWLHAGGGGADQVKQAWRDPWMIELPGDAENQQEEQKILARTLMAPPAPSSSSFVPPSALSSFLDRLASRLPSLSSRLPPSTCRRLVSSLRSSTLAPSLPFFHYFAFMTQVEAREFDEALENGYRYFDFFSAHLAQLTKQLEQQAEEGESLTQANEALLNRPRRTQQYASLALAQLNYSFQFYLSAVVSLQECIKLSQQNKDEHCLRCAVEMLHKIVESKGTMPAVGATTSLQQRMLLTQANADMRSARQTSAKSATSASSGSAQGPLPHLDAANAIMLAKFMVQHVDARKGANQPQRVWRQIERALCLVSSYSSNSSPRTPSLLSSTHLLRSSAWHLFGSPSLSHLSGHSALLHHLHAPSLDTIHALVQLSLNPSAAPSYEVSRAILDFIKVRYPYPTQHGVQEMVTLAEVELEMKRGDYVRANEVAQHLYALSPSKLVSFQHWSSAQFVELRLDYYLARASPASCFLRLLSLVSECTARFERGTAAHFLRFLPVLLSSPSSALNGGQPSTLLHQVGLCSLMSAVSLAKSLHFTSIEVELLMAVASLHLEWGNIDECERIVKEKWSDIVKQSGGSKQERNTNSAAAPALAPSPSSSLPPSIPAGDSSPLHLQCRGYLLLAQCALARMDPEHVQQMDAEERTAAWEHIAQQLKQALTVSCDSSQQRQIYYLLARCYQELGMKAERNAAALHFCRLEQQGA